MIRVYVKTFVGEFKNEALADAYLHKDMYNFDEDTQPIFEEVECEHEDEITYLDVSRNWVEDGKKRHDIDIVCDTCGATGVQCEELDEVEDEWVFVAEAWHKKEDK